MSRLLGLSNSNSGNIVSYFGSMVFLDNQAVFDDIFGTKPMLPENNSTKLDSKDTREKISGYADKCIFEVFLELCRADYVGEVFGDSEVKMVREVCKNIGEIKMEYKSGTRNRWTTDTPDELYDNFISVVAALPDDATKWSLSLCDRYYSALTNSLQDKMEEDSFSIPCLNGLITKTLQLRALRTVQTATVSSYPSLLKEELRLHRVLSSNNRHFNQNSLSLYYEPDVDTHGNIHYHTPSQVENTLVRYVNGPS